MFVCMAVVIKTQMDIHRSESRLAPSRSFLSPVSKCLTYRRFWSLTCIFCRLMATFLLHFWFTFLLQFWFTFMLHFWFTFLFAFLLHFCQILLIDFIRQTILLLKSCKCKCIRKNSRVKKNSCTYSRLEKNSGKVFPKLTH